MSDHWVTVPTERNTAQATQAEHQREDPGEAAWLGVGTAKDVLFTVWAGHPDTIIPKIVGGHLWFLVLSLEYSWKECLWFIVLIIVWVNFSERFVFVYNFKFHRFSFVHKKNTFKISVAH